MIKNFHEAPKSIFKRVQEVTSGDYALVHLFEEDPEYLELFVQAVKDGREVILDNSVFELGVAFEASKFAGWVERLRPTWYIVPDVLEDAAATVESFNNFVALYPNLPGKRIGVVQGKSYEECVWCYRQLVDRCDMIAFSFDMSMYAKDDSDSRMNYWERLAYGRVDFIARLWKDRVLCPDKPHHLLGVALPQEIGVYAWLEARKCIYSVDTSNPVVAGILGERYMDTGLTLKPKDKLYKMINRPVTEEEVADVLHNIELFRRFCDV